MRNEMCIWGSQGHDRNSVRERSVVRSMFRVVFDVLDAVKSHPAEYES